VALKQQKNGMVNKKTQCPIKKRNENRKEKNRPGELILDGSLCIQVLEIRQKSLKNPEKAPKRQKIRTIILSKS
jgi:hypothetical protein